MFYKKFCESLRKIPVSELLSNKVAGLRSATPLGVLTKNHARRFCHTLVEDVLNMPGLE